MGRGDPEVYLGDRSKQETRIAFAELASALRRGSTNPDAHPAYGGGGSGCRNWNQRALAPMVFVQ